MDLPVEEFIEGLLSEEALKTPPNTEKPEFDLPPWYDEKKYEKARDFYWTFCFSLSSAMLMGLVAVFAIPSILKVLIGTKRSNSEYTAYRRYASTLLHTVGWFEYPLKPGTLSWKSLRTVRSRHHRADKSSRAQGTGTVSQRDIALTQFGFLGFALLKPDKFGIAPKNSDDWENYNHFWRTIGYIMGLDDRYNICRNTVAETREVCRLLQSRVYTPCLDNSPEYFEHMARVMLDGMWCINPGLDTSSALYFCKYLGDVPGYICTEGERLELENKLRKAVKGSETDVDVSAIIEKAGIHYTPAESPRKLRIIDYQVFDDMPEYKRLTVYERFRLYIGVMVMTLYSFTIFRVYFNLQYRLNIFFTRHFPYVAMFRYGIKKSFVDIFTEDPTDDSKPKPNKEYLKPRPPQPWYKACLSFINIF